MTTFTRMYCVTILDGKVGIPKHLYTYKYTKLYFIEALLYRTRGSPYQS
jgi:hypothetical protein